MISRDVNAKSKKDVSAVLLVVGLLMAVGGYALAQQTPNWPPDLPVCDPGHHWNSSTNGCVADQAPQPPYPTSSQEDLTNATTLTSVSDLDWTGPDPVGPYISVAIASQPQLYPMGAQIMPSITACLQDYINNNRTGEQIYFVNWVYGMSAVMVFPKGFTLSFLGGGLNTPSGQYSAVAILGVVLLAGGLVMRRKAKAGAKA